MGMSEQERKNARRDHVIVRRVEDGTFEFQRFERKSGKASDQPYGGFQTSEEAQAEAGRTNPYVEVVTERQARAAAAPNPEQSATGAVITTGDVKGDVETKPRKPATRKRTAKKPTRKKPTARKPTSS